MLMQHRLNSQDFLQMKMVHSQINLILEQHIMGNKKRLKHIQLIIHLNNKNLRLKLNRVFIKIMRRLENYKPQVSWDRNNQKE